MCWRASGRLCCEMIMGMKAFPLLLALSLSHYLIMCRSSTSFRRCTILTWISGPFADSTTFSDCKNSAITDVSTIAGAEAVKEDELLLLRNLKYRERVSVAFVSDNNMEHSVELRWAQFRGNMQLVHLGENYRSLVLNPGDVSLQFSSAGHLFVAMLYDESRDTSAHRSEDLFEELEGSIRRIVVMYLIPAGVDEVTFTFGHKDVLFHNLDGLMDLCGDSCRTRQPHTIGARDSECYRSMLLTYWEHQRLSQVPLHIWAVPTIPVAVLPVALADVAESGADIATRQLWRIAALSPSLTAEVNVWHMTYRETERIVEPPISLVFNQLQARTFYVPLPEHLLQRIVEEVRILVANWLGVQADTLEVTGAYASREYQRDAVVRWHVDPVESQPLTAIIHIAAAADSHARDAVCSNDEVCEEIAEPGSWTLQMPKSLDSFASYNLSSTYTAHIHENAYDPDNLENIELQPGQVLLLQSAKLPHARLVPLRGEWYANAFVHFAPSGWAEQEVVQLLH